MLPGPVVGLARDVKCQIKWVSKKSRQLHSTEGVGQSSPMSWEFDRSRQKTPHTRNRPPGVCMRTAHILSTKKADLVFFLSNLEAQTSMMRLHEFLHEPTRGWHEQGARTAPNSSRATYARRGNTISPKTRVSKMSIFGVSFEMVAAFLPSTTSPTRSHPTRVTERQAYHCSLPSTKLPAHRDIVHLLHTLSHFLLRLTSSIQAFFQRAAVDWLLDCTDETSEI